MNRQLLPCLALLSLSACVTTGWQATHYNDEFTDANICRVQYGAKEPGLTQALTGGVYTNYFYAENHDGEIRAGIRSEPPIPIAGDVQIKVGDTLYTLTSNDVPLDVAPKVSAPNNIDAGYAASMSTITESIQKISSPYRAFQGKKAKQLLKHILALTPEQDVKFRVVGVNTKLGGTGSFKPDDGFKAALDACDITL